MATGAEGKVARATGLEPATSGVTGRHSNQLSYAPTEERRGYGWPHGRSTRSTPESALRSQPVRTARTGSMRPIFQIG